MTDVTAGLEICEQYRFQSVRPHNLHLTTFAGNFEGSMDPGQNIVEAQG